MSPPIAGFSTNKGLSARRTGLGASTLVRWTLLSASLWGAAGCTSAGGFESEAKPPEQPAMSRYGRRVQESAQAPVQPLSPSAEAHGVGLRAQPSSDEVAALATHVLEAVIREDKASLRKAFHRRANWQQRTMGGRQMRAMRMWSRRLSRLSYRKLATRAFFDPRQIRVENAASVRARGRILPPRVRLKEGQFWVEVPISVVRIGADRYFGDQIGFVIGPTKSGLRILSMHEDLQVP